MGSCTIGTGAVNTPQPSAESFFGRLKSEWVNHQRYLIRSEAIQSLFYYIKIFYNRKRRHSSIEYETPQE